MSWKKPFHFSMRIVSRLAELLNLMSRMFNCRRGGGAAVEICHEWPTFILHQLRNQSEWTLVFHLWSKVLHLMSVNPLRGCRSKWMNWLCQTKYSPIKLATKLFLAGISVLLIPWLLLTVCASSHLLVIVNLVVSWLSPDMFQVAFCLFDGSDESIFLLCNPWSPSSTWTPVNLCGNKYAKKKKVNVRKFE